MRTIKYYLYNYNLMKIIIENIKKGLKKLDILLDKNIPDKEALEEHAQEEKNETARDDECYEKQARIDQYREEYDEQRERDELEREGSPEYPLGNMAEPHDLRGDR